MLRFLPLHGKAHLKKKTSEKVPYQLRNVLPNKCKQSVKHQHQCITISKTEVLKEKVMFFECKGRFYKSLKIILVKIYN